MRTELRYFAAGFAVAATVATMAPAQGQTTFGGIAASAREPLDTSASPTQREIGALGSTAPGSASMGSLGMFDPLAIGTSRLPAIGTTSSLTSNSTAGNSVLAPIETPSPFPPLDTLPTIGTSLPPTIGTPLNPTIGTSLPPTIGTSLSPTIGTSLPPVIGTQAPPLGTATNTPIGATRAPGAASPGTPPAAPGTALGSGGASSAAGLGGGVPFDPLCRPEDFTCGD
jgi:hypothetical protein